MDKIKLIILKRGRYEKVKSGQMTTWLTLNDDFAKSIQVGDLLRIMDDETSEVCYAECTGFYAYGSFEELYNKCDKNTLGYDGNDKNNIEKIKKDMYEQCTPEAEKKHGVRGIKFDYMPDFKTADDMSREELEALLKHLNKECKSTFKQTFKYFDKSEETIGYLTHLAKHQPDILFDNIDEQNYDILKWSIVEQINELKQLLDTLQEKEDELDFPIIRKYKFPDAYSDGKNPPKKKK